MWIKLQSENNGSMVLLNVSTLVLDCMVSSQKIVLFKMLIVLLSGYSFTESDDGYARNETAVGEDLYNALLQFFQLFPELQKREFYVTGESYAGKSKCVYLVKENPFCNSSFAVIRIRGHN